MRTKTLWIKDGYLQFILAGRKTVEVREGYSNMARLQAGDRLLLDGRHANLIGRIGRYAYLKELLAHEDPDSIAPGVPLQELNQVLRAIYPADKEALGVLALEIKPEASGYD